jgi:ubiquinone/menaquinone biosynthesis C-methylase UbiE
VLAVDIRRLPLAFLRVRTWLKGSTNVEILAGEPDDPHLGETTADGVLIVNTYHELQHPRTILDRSFRALVSGGRLVIADRSSASEGHHVSLSAVEADVRDSGFQIIQRIDSFIDNPKSGQWWLLVASRP